MDSKWRVRSTPREWQRAALKIWANSKAGVVSVVTGAGKTMFAIQCIELLHRERPNVRCLIAVPTTALLDQWRVVLQRELGLEPEDIGLLGAGYRLSGGEQVVVAVLDSLRKKIDEITRDAEWFLIVDECHRVASSSNRGILAGSYIATLGLSATPERQYDGWFQEYVVPALGPVIFRYTYEDARRDGILADFALWNIRIPLTQKEQTAIDGINKRIRREAGRLKSMGLRESDYLRRLLLTRSRLSQGASARLSTTISIIRQWGGKRGLVFHESVEAAEFIQRSLVAKHYRARLYHSGMSSIARFENLRLYSEGQVDVLVSCRALDEGFDVPDTDFGIIAASSASRRQRTQRLGRILRPSPSGARATIATLYALDSEEEQLRDEASRLEGVGEVRWFGAHRI